jgi:ubiquinone/menaquinone biosynthesis C-methylase UbiE
VATGTGAAAIAAARSVGPAGQVVGVDIATDMLERARRKIEAAQLTNIEYHEGDAEHLSYAEKSFDAVICAFGVFFLPEMLAGPREWKRVVKEGGVVAFSAFGETVFQPLSDLFEAHIRAYGGDLSRVKAPVLLATTYEHRAVLHLAAGCWLEQIEGRAKQLGYYLRTPQQWWEIVWNSGFRGPVSQLSAGQVVQFKYEQMR